MRRLLFGLVVAACSGPGPQGEQGERGRAGEDAVIDVRNASVDECPNGGDVITVGVGSDLEEVVLCNGEDGEDGAPGEPGADGETGATGPAGEDGAPGQDGSGESIGRIVATISCSGDVSGAYYLQAYQHIVVFGDGSVWTSARITDGYNSASESMFYAPEQLGANTATVVVTFDVVQPSVGGFWTVSFDVVEFRSVITYTDSDLSAGGKTWALPGSACVVNEY